MKLSSLYISVYLASPFWTLVLPFVSTNRIYRGISYAVCLFFFTVVPIWTSVIDRAADGGLGMLLSVGVNILAAILAVVLVLQSKKRHHRIFFVAMLGCAVAGILGAFAVRM